MRGQNRFTAWYSTCIDMRPAIISLSTYQYITYARAKLYCMKCSMYRIFSAHWPLSNRQRIPPTGPVLEYFSMRIVACSIWSPTALCVCRKSPLLVWRDLVDAVAHAYRRFLVGPALEMGLPTTWKGDGRVESRQLQSTWGPSKYATLLNTVFRTGLLKPAYASVW